MTDKYGKIHTDGSRSGGQPVVDSIEAKALALMGLIIPKPKPDPLVHVLDSLEWCNTEALAKDLREALDAFGFDIREKGQ